MTIVLPKPIANYFKADKENGEAIVACFSENAVVKDEGQTHMGLDAIRHWKMSTSSKYTYTVEPQSLRECEEKMIVTGLVAGNFPGSPVNLQYAFTLDGDNITALEISL
ncbi:nuclear transport factor 2 family protein [Marinomonas foliarum]|uniref:Nuclear transport factor 2 family protein n=1 Tax=Marinomonas foliarum TaxID=491950 RepID=A0ABX7IJZ1_9GAMM|nr:nuclear transport factor 2 family protein [Marinomonas foliarum]QRV22510.1 nuclear transport factor 2 family protein [Marinomonas foliarum]